jgi:L-aminopeptidase/D-esterase-like protein
MMTVRKWLKLDCAPALGLALTALTLTACAAMPQEALAEPRPQTDLPALINDGFESDAALSFDWPMLEIGTGQYEDGPTGLTVLKFGKKVNAAVDARGGGPGTVNAEYLKLGYTQPELDAIVLAGGSWYGLEAVTAANTALLDDGYRGGNWDNVGLVVGSIIYDFGGRRLNEIYPDKRLAQLALRAAEPGIFPNGAYGAGRSAMNGGIFGCHARSGQGSAYRQVGDVKIAVFTVVNALGTVTDREGNVVACHKGDSWPETLKATDLMRAAPDSLQPGWNGEEDTKEVERKNTTISVVVTNRTLSPAELQRLAVQVHTSMARGIQPFASEFDGDVLYAVSTNEVDAGPGATLPSMEIGVTASELMWDAILAAMPEEQVTQPEPDPELVISASALDKYAGTYRFSHLAELTVRVEDGALVASATGERDVFQVRKGSPRTLLAATPDIFTVERGRYPFSVQFTDDTVIVNPGRWQQTGRRVSGN